MIKAIAIDDEPLALEVIKAYCKKVDYIELQGVFSETSAALRYMKDNPVDLLFLDINMPAMSGIDLYKKIGMDTMVIFTTAYSEYAVEGFNLSAVDYLLKPFDFGRFQKAAERAREFTDYNKKKDSEPQQFIFLRVDYSMVKLLFQQIVYIEGLDNYIKIHLDNSKPLMVRMSMKAIAEKLPVDDFVRVHRSYIVPKSKIRAVRNKIIYLDKAEIPVGTNYADEVQKLTNPAG